MRILTTLTLLVFITACGKQNPKEDTKVQTGYNIYGKVDKTLNYEKKYLTKVGKLFYTTKTKEKDVTGSCTASLVGDNLLLTAAHCIYDNETGEMHKDFNFYLGFTDKVAIASSRLLQVWYGSKTPLKDGSYQDWAIATLEKPLGETYGYFGTKTIKNNIDNNAYDIALAGYGHLFEGGNFLTVHEGCNVRNVVQSLILQHDCDMAKGDSGAPLIKCDKDDRCYVTGVNSYERGGELKVFAEYDLRYHNGAISSAQFDGLLRRLRKQEAAKKIAQE